MLLNSENINELVDLCTKEIILLHVFFEEWFSSKIYNTKKEFSKLENVLSKDFFLINPSGKILRRKEIIDMIGTSYGRYKENPTRFKIWIKNVTYQYLYNNVITLTYEEWQKTDNETKVRLSSVVFSINYLNESNLDLKWLHVHEVWIS